MLVAAGLVALASVGVALITTSYGGSKDGSPVAVVDTANRTDPTGDADGDGVPDWKEILWSTDPYNPDTDGDGVGDAEEIASGTNPLKAGTENSASAEYTAPKALTPTEALSRELFANYAAAKQSGAALSTNEANAVASGAITKNVPDIGKPKTYILSDLNVSSGAAIEVYQTALLHTFEKMTAIREYELTTFARVIENDDTSGLEKLVTAGKVYGEVVKDMLSMPVPPKVAEVHLATVNDLSGLAHATDALTTWNGDALFGLDLVNNFAKAEEAFGNSVSSLYQLINNLK